MRKSYQGGIEKSIEIVTVSSKGQVVLPVEMRKRLAIDSGDKLAVSASGDLIMLKPIKLPTEDDFSSRLDEAQQWAASVGYQESDVNDLIKQHTTNTFESKSIGLYGKGMLASNLLAMSFYQQI